MFFQQLHSKDASLSYFFGCGGLGKAVAVDVVAGDEDWFIEQAKAANVEISYVIDTHLHADHYSGGAELARRTAAPYCLHQSAADVVSFPFTALHDGEVLSIGNVSLQILHTPGHTPESMCLLVTDRRRGDEPWFVLTGDTLFVGAVGRPDLAGREAEMAGLLFDSLQRKLLPLPDAIEIYPGHKAGSLCGAGLSGKPASTLGFERRWNTMLGVATREQFIAELLPTIPLKPALMAQMLARNCGLASASAP
ncbi:MBL fold metallo-hydrolase [Permianibacter sp. IMCC34836]|uniref:MBL fold metallo-hydrolase n=1 Tax=Permianibacter fluminis TaxID=2738515 RepID=UPI0015519634|nr:MBL fold metallo-hydrolase [Permianibacter fluminis]NQD38258.1 MBL fold metallo-hydrolase [Permianibacter fluminis]